MLTPNVGDQYTFIALASSTKAIVAYRTGKRDSENTDLFVRDLRERVIGMPEISTDGFHPYKPAIRDAFTNRVAHGVVQKTYSVSDLRKDASHRYSPAAVVAVNYDVVSGVPAEISTSYNGAQQPLAPHGVSSLYAVDQRFQQEARATRRGHFIVCGAL